MREMSIDKSEWIFLAMRRKKVSSRNVKVISTSTIHIYQEMKDKRVQN